MATSRQKRMGLTTKNENGSKKNETSKLSQPPKSLINVTAPRPSSPSTISTSDTTPPPPKYADESGISKVDPSSILDMPSLYNPNLHLPNKPNFAALSHIYESATPLGDKLEAYIGIRGPITVAEYMNFVLNDEEYGYYTNPTTAAALRDDNKDDDDDDDWDNDDDDDWDSPANESSQEGVIGIKGDFTTAPEISQIFGESLLIYLITQWKDLGKPTAIQLIELGPGRGTLMADVLRTAMKNFPDFVQALGNGGGVHLVEVAGGLRQKQKETLSKLMQDLNNENEGKNDNNDDDEEWSFEFLDETDYDSSSDVKVNDDNCKNSKNKISIRWHSHFSDLSLMHNKQTLSNDVSRSSSPTEPSIITSTNRTAEEQLSQTPINEKEKQQQTQLPPQPPKIPAFILCQEMIDALPIHSFQKTNDGVWRERLVDVAMKKDDEQKQVGGDVVDNTQENYRKAYQQVEQQQATSSDTSASTTTTTTTTSKEKKQRFRFVLPPDTTPALRTLLNVDPKTGKTNSSITYLDDANPGDIIEVNPDGMMLVQDMASFIEYNNGGAALIIDYGGEGSAGDTLRAFQKHKQVHPLTLPGWVDVTADVDFGALKMAVNQRNELSRESRNKSTSRTQQQQQLNMTTEASTNSKEGDPIMAFGPISHCHFLASMGAPDRVVQLIEQDDTTDEQAQDLFDALERLMHPDQMGERYKVLAIGRKKDGIFHPPGF